MNARRPGLRPPRGAWAWWYWSLGFAAGSLLASYLTLACAVGSAQSPGGPSGEVRAALASASAAYGVPYADLSRVAWCESRWRPWVDNDQGSGAQGLFQFMPRTYRWMSQQAGWGGSSPYDPWAAAHVAAWAFANNYATHWSCR